MKGAKLWTDVRELCHHLAVRLKFLDLSNLFVCHTMPYSYYHILSYINMNGHIIIHMINGMGSISIYHSYYHIIHPQCFSKDPSTSYQLGSARPVCTSQRGPDSPSSGCSTRKAPLHTLPHTSSSLGPRKLHNFKIGVQTVQKCSKQWIVAGRSPGRI